MALEGALKLKEISYIATDAYAAGEMKHGPIALLDESTPVVVRRDRLAGAREGDLEHPGGPGAGRARDRDRHRGRRARSATHADEVIRVPRTDWMLAPLLAVIPLQLLAYYIARQRGSTSTSRATWPRRSRSSDALGALAAGAPGIGIDLLEIERLEHALERRPRLAERLFTDAEREYAAARAVPVSTWPPASAPRRRSPRRWG